jgi:2-keto-4-pentenoate hydratase/2-oxohepta-3-ene-1,7-dioic acid hydratase in catechol pathway
MRLCTYEIKTPIGRLSRLGAVLDQGIADLHFAARLRFGSRLAQALVPPSMRDFLQGEDESMDAARQALAALPRDAREGPDGETLIHDPSQVRLLAPIPNPASVRDFYAFEQHVQTGFAKRGEPMPDEWYQIPVYYKSGHHNIIGTDTGVLWPSFTERFDYELELAAVIGKRGRNLSGDAAWKSIAGFTVMNDFSARDIQRREMKVRLGPAKGKDWCTALGPVLVTPDELPDPLHLEMTARVNGEEWSRGNSRDMHWSFAQMIEFLTLDDEILPGDVLGSGTVGTGCGLELDRWVQPGDQIELEVEAIGTLSNRVVR